MACNFCTALTHVSPTEADGAIWNVVLVSNVSGSVSFWIPVDPPCED